ncbi:uncharacterized protein HKW66_Vig0202290 [Vigna angularis]|uniref:Uncharacterized protein n=1 Tax=Phaseolus angularis TaxID=3914 RepID=A0A8T0JUJ6_PHAAN|nr:uncharacterized protein HKW66_Vig0202290 [Vigna angularis]
MAITTQQHQHHVMMMSTQQHHNDNKESNEERPNPIITFMIASMTMTKHNENDKERGSTMRMRRAKWGHGEYLTAGFHTANLKVSNDRSVVKPSNNIAVYIKLLSGYGRRSLEFLRFEFKAGIPLRASLRSKSLPEGIEKLGRKDIGSE